VGVARREEKKSGGLIGALRESRAMPYEINTKLLASCINGSQSIVPRLDLIGP
jgi:hypothetical protein